MRGNITSLLSVEARTGDMGTRCRLMGRMQFSFRTNKNESWWRWSVQLQSHAVSSAAWPGRAARVQHCHKQLWSAKSKGRRSWIPVSYHGKDNVVGQYYLLSDDVSNPLDACFEPDRHSTRPSRWRHCHCFCIYFVLCTKGIE
jgi:hypothetical protein